MTDIRTTWSPDLMMGDWLIDPPALADDADLETAVLISLFTDARAAPDDRLPGATGDVRGWWAGPLGSKLWLLTREKATNDVRLRAEQYCQTALQWLLDDAVADRIDIAATWSVLPSPPGRLDIAVDIYRTGRLLLARHWGWAWLQEAALAL